MTTSRQFIDKIEQAFEKTAKNAIDGMQERLTGEHRPYPNTTVRRYGKGKTGKYASSPRDVVDSEELVNSLEVNTETTTTGIVVTAEWTADHAWFVLRDAKSPYNWILLALRILDLQEEFKRELRNVGIE